MLFRSTTNWPVESHVVPVVFGDEHTDRSFWGVITSVEDNSQIFGPPVRSYGITSYSTTPYGETTPTGIFYRHDVEELQRELPFHWTDINTDLTEAEYDQLLQDALRSESARIERWSTSSFRSPTQPSNSRAPRSPPSANSHSPNGRSNRSSR